MLTVFLIMAMIGRGQSWDSTGYTFFTVFPENIAFYYPINPVNAVNITTLFDSLVTVSANNELIYKKVVTAGKPVTVNIPPEDEEFRLNESLRIVTIFSQYRAVVQSFNHRGDSVQTNVVQPLKNLGTFYTIPSLNYTQMINAFFQSTKNISKKYSSFRLFIVNVGGTNSFTIVKKSTKVLYKLDPNAVLQLQTDGTEIAIQSIYNVAVLLTHPCMETPECGCNMVMTQLYPDSLWGSSFIVPSIENMTNVWLHVMPSSNATSSSLTPLPPKAQFINTSEPASLKLVAPGFITEVIPLSLFSVCYLVPVSSSNAQALVIAETAHRDSVYIDGDLLSSTKWSDIDDSRYSSVAVPLDKTCVIWHPFTRIGVYVFERNTNTYGGAAIALSQNTDPLGCALTPSKFNVVSKLQTWPESHQNCMVGSDELFSPSNKAAQMEMANVLNTYSLSEPLWIGLRRSLLTLDWYRQKGNNVYKMNYTRWGSGEPSAPVRGMCASIFPDSELEFQWQSMPCCAQLKSVCYTRAEYFPLYFPIDRDSLIDSESTANKNNGFA